MIRLLALLIAAILFTAQLWLWHPEDREVLSNRWDTSITVKHHAYRKEYSRVKLSLDINAGDSLEIESFPRYGDTFVSVYPRLVDGKQCYFPDETFGGKTIFRAKLCIEGVDKEP